MSKNIIQIVQRSINVFEKEVVNLIIGGFQNTEFHNNKTPIIIAPEESCEHIIADLIKTQIFKSDDFFIDKISYYM